MHFIPGPWLELAAVNRPMVVYSWEIRNPYPVTSTNEVQNALLTLLHTKRIEG